MKKRVILTVTNDLSHDQRMMRICHSLASAGYAVQLVGRQRTASLPVKEQDYAQHRLPMIFEQGKAFYLEYHIRLCLYLLFRPADLICSIDLDTALPCLIAGKLRGKPVFQDAHECFPEVPELQGRMEQRVWRSVERWTMARFNEVYTVSGSIARYFADSYGIEATVIRNLPNRAERRNPSEGTAPYLLYQGALNKGRGLEEILQALPDLPLPLKIAGEGDLSAALRSLAGELGVLDRVQFLGWVDPEELKKLSAGAFLGFNLLDGSSRSYRYSLANKFFDYIQAGIPSLNMDFPEYAALNAIKPVALLLDELSPEAVEKAVRTLWEDRALHRALADNAASRSEELNWEEESVKLLQIYRKTLG